MHRLFSPFLLALFGKSKKASRNFCCWWHCDTITIRITLVVVAEGCHHLPSASFVFACIRFASFCSWNCQGSLGHPPHVLVTWIIYESQLSEPILCPGFTCGAQAAPAGSWTAIIIKQNDQTKTQYLHDFTTCLIRPMVVRSSKASPSKRDREDQLLT